MCTLLQRPKYEINVWNVSLTIVSPTSNQSEVAFLDTSFMEVLFDQQKLSSDPKDNYSSECLFGYPPNV